MNMLAGLVGYGIDKAFGRVVGSVMEYSKQTAASHVAYGTMNSIIDQCTAKGTNIGGGVGGKVGTVAGKILAGASLETIQKEKEFVASALGSAGTIAAKAASTEPTKSNLLNNAINVAKYGLLIGGGVAAATTGAIPLSALLVANAGLTALPEVIDAFKNDPKDGREIGLEKDVLGPIVQQGLITAISFGAGNYVRAETVQRAFQTRIQTFNEVGEVVSEYLPNCVKPLVTGAANIAGKIDAPRHALSTEVVNNANAAGDLTSEAMKTTLGFGAALMNKNESKLKERLLLTAGLVGTGALLALAPEVAILPLGIAGLGVLGKTVTLIKGQLSSAPAKVVNPLPKVVVDSMKATATTENAAVVLAGG